MKDLEQEKKSILKDIYKSMGIFDYYKENGGIGFGLLEESNPYNIILLDEAYEVLFQARKATDDSGIEHFFSLISSFCKSDDEIHFVCTSGILDNNSVNANNGKCKASSDYTDKLNKTINEEQPDFIIMCHTHPNYKQTVFDRRVYDESLPNRANLKLRELGMNISDGDIKGFISYKITQEQCSNRFYFLNGISLPNGEFNIFDLNNLRDNPTLVSIPNILRLKDDDLVSVPNIWNAEKTKRK